MKLRDYLDETKTTAQAFAEKIGRSPSTVTRILAGQHIPDPKTMRSIIDETGGRVTPNDFFDPESSTDSPAAHFESGAAP